MVAGLPISSEPWLQFLVGRETEVAGRRLNEVVVVVRIVERVLQALLIRPVRTAGFCYRVGEQFPVGSGHQIIDGNVAAIEAGITASTGMNKRGPTDFVVCDIQIHCGQLRGQHISHVCRIGVEQEAIQRRFVGR